MADLSEPNASRVVLVGTAVYTHQLDLPAVRNNLTELAAIVNDPALWGVPEENIRVCEDASSPSAVADIVREAARSVSDDGLLLIYFAGHGLINYDGTLVLSLPATDPEFPGEAGLQYESIRRAVIRSPARRKLVILDCCYAGRASDDMAGDSVTSGTDAVADKAEIEGTCLLVSAPRNRTAQAPEGATYTAFTGELVRLLRGGLPGGSAVLDMTTIWRRIRQELQAKGYERPELRARDAGAGIPLVRNAAVSKDNLVGTVLAAAPHVTDRDIERTVVLILRHDRKIGALGVRITGPTRPLPDEFPAEWQTKLAEPMGYFHGGPVQPDEPIAVAMLRRGAIPPLRFTQVRGRLGTVALSADPDGVVPALAGLRVFTGYLGWGPGELEADLAGGLFLPPTEQADLVLSSHPGRIWSALQRPSGPAD